jgi:hypothetical protein
MFHATNVALNDYYGGAPWYAIQWHGMAASTCPTTEVYPSHGRKVTPLPSDKISVLRDNLLVAHPAWKVDLPGSNVCGLNGTENVQGRLFNGVAPADLCSKYASSYTGKFVHIEQDPGFRNASDWIAPITATWP